MARPAHCIIFIPILQFVGHSAHDVFALLFARVVDFWQSYSPLPIRTIAVVLVIATIASVGPRLVGRLQPATAFFETAAVDGGKSAHVLPIFGLTVSDSWLAHLKMRLDAIPEDGPVVFVAASGGGSRAALFTALVFEHLNRTPVSCKGHPDYHIGDHLLLVSSVSGGTLASACYVDDQYRRNSSTDLSHKPKNFFAEETLALMIDALPSIKGRPWYEGSRNNGSWVEWWRAAEDCCGDNEDARWFFKRPLVDDMCTDFMAPLLRGVLYPMNDRGHSTMQFWQRRFGLSATNLDWHRRIATRLFDAASGKDTVVSRLTDWPPLLLCNVSEVERGNRTIIGFPPLPPDLLTFDIDAPHFPREWIALDAGDGKIDQVCEVSLAEATRLSANFPWGFPVVRVDIPQSTPTGGQRPDVRFVDGAVADNTGIDSLRYVVDRLRAWANRAGRSAAISSSEERAGTKLPSRSSMSS